VAGFAVSAVGWLALAVAPASVFGVVLFGFMLTCFSGGATLIFVNFLSLRQAVTPEPLLGRMTSTMRWLILIGAGPGALIGGYVGEHIGLRASLAMAGLSADTQSAQAGLATNSGLIACFRYSKNSSAPIRLKYRRYRQSRCGRFCGPAPRGCGRTWQQSPSPPASSA